MAASNTFNYTQEVAEQDKEFEEAPKTEGKTHHIHEYKTVLS